MAFEDGLFALMKANSTVQDFWGTNNNGAPEYQVFYLGTFEPVKTPPYCVFRRHRRTHEMDLESVARQFISGYFFEIYHEDSWALLDLQQRLRTLIESLLYATVGGINIQQIEIEDDFHIPPDKDVELRLYKGVLVVELYYNPN